MGSRIAKNSSQGSGQQSNGETSLHEGMQQQASQTDKTKPHLWLLIKGRKDHSGDIVNMAESTLSNLSEIKDKIYKCQMVGFEEQHPMFNSYNLDKSYKEMVNKF